MRELKIFILKLCKINIVRNALMPIVALIGKKTYVERLQKLAAEEKYFKSTNFNKIIKRGPFKDMTYNSFNSYGSELAPKIIGSYEQELNSIIENIISNKDYSEILDVGCAEGYYAVGLAMRKPLSKIYAYDVKEEARNLCRQMAEANGVLNRIQLEGFCNAATLANFNFSKRGLVISDCEGYEKQLFKKSCLPNLKNCDILIELHDFIDPSISAYINELFKDTHQIKIIQSFIRNPKDYPELSIFSDVEKRLILSECRRGILNEQKMEWAFITSNSSFTRSDA